MRDDKLRITILLSRETVKRIDEDKLCRGIFLGKRTPMIEQILRKHYGMPSMFDMEKKE